MTGVGNGDPYLGLDAQPTLASMCRPTTEDSRPAVARLNGYQRLYVSVFGAGPDTSVNIKVVKQVDGTGITWAESEAPERSIVVNPCEANNGGGDPLDNCHSLEGNVS